VSAVRDGRSLDNTMGFSPLEGVPMATRSGSVDPGALIYLMRERGLDAEALEHALNFDSGLRGLAGGRDGMLEVEEAAADGDADAALAIGVFAHRVAAAVAAMAASAGGLDALVFTAGIGEGSAPTRKRICERLDFLGVELDDDRNAAAEPDCEVAAAVSAVRVLVVRAREELVAASAARSLLALNG
jgi:acetate kinase